MCVPSNAVLGAAGSKQQYAQDKGASAHDVNNLARCCNSSSGHMQVMLGDEEPSNTVLHAMEQH